MNLDMQTLLAITGSLTFVMTIYLFVLWVINRNETKGVGISIFGIGFLSLGSLLTSSQGRIPDFLTIVIGNTIVLLGMSLFHLSIRVFLELRRNNPVQYLLYLLTFAIFIEQYVFGIISPNLQIRAVFVSCSVVIFYTCMALLFYKERTQLAAPGYFMLILFTIQAVSTLIRIPIILIQPTGSEFLKMQGYHTLAIAIHALCMSSWPIGYAMLISEKQKHKAVKMNEQNVLLLQELAHRTKNNMSLILSLIDWQKNVLPKKESYTLEEIHSSLKTVENRILSMSIVHKRLYMSDDLSSIALGDYIDELALSIHDSFAEPAHRITTKTNIDDIVLSIDTSIHIGLIINELMTNSYKHAFNNGAPGVIDISAEKTADNRIILSYSDNGPGCDIDMNVSGGGIGMQMIRILGEQQLHGTLEFSSDSGFSCVLSIPLS